jgi:hypothetical protein
MSASRPDANGHPAPHADRMSVSETFFCLFAAPVAWLLQLTCGYALASEPCFREGEGVLAVPAQLYWTWPAMVVLTAAAVALALAALAVSLSAFRRTRHETPGDARDLMDVGAGRTRFVALWGIFLGGGFALAAAITAVAFLALPRCAG